MIVYLIRHGESEINKDVPERTPETPLSEKGRQQAQSVAKRLANVKIDIIYSSRYQRTKQTAGLISEAINKPIEYWEHLIEFNGQKETFEQLNQRSQTILDHLLSHHKDQSVLCVSHASMIETIIAKMIFGDHLSLQIMLDIKEHTGTTHTGVSICEFTHKHGWVVHSLNGTNHL